MTPEPHRDDGPVTSAAPEVSHVRRVLKIWAALSVIGVVLVLVLAPIVNPSSASASAGFANLTNVLFTAMAVPVGLFVWVFVGYSLVVFRARKPASGRIEDLEDGPPLQAKPGYQIAWLAITASLAIFLVGWGMFGFYKQTTDPPAKPLVVYVTGQQWTWTYTVSLARGAEQRARAAGQPSCAVPRHLR